MPVLHHFTISKAFKLFIFFLFIPWIIFSLSFILFPVILLLPFFFAFLFAYICYKIIFRCNIRILPSLFSNHKSFHKKPDENSKFIKQESVELDGPELPSPDASDEEEEIRQIQDQEEIRENNEQVGKHQEHTLGEDENRGLKSCRIKTEKKETEESEKKGGEDDEKYRRLKLRRIKAKKKEMEESEKKGGEDDEKFRELKLCTIKAETKELKPFQEKISFWRRIESGDVRMRFNL